ncbi:mycofactocin system transcriptional regulator [Streptomyces canus]|uniref:mycofactocin system transcriptional regulator n=1 Tax=Streptomyces canus TaxID=58343 RepID=UPI00367E792A
MERSRGRETAVDEAGARGERPRGRPRGTSARALDLIALRLFSERGFDRVTVDDIAAEAGVTRRTFFRYFESKAAVLWHGWDTEVARLQRALVRIDDEVPLMRAVRQAVVDANRTRGGDPAELRTRMTLLTASEALMASAAPHYEAWGRAISEYAARRLGVPAGALIPLAVGRTTVAACRAAYDCWLAEPESDLTAWLDEALGALGDGFAAHEGGTQR